jgi:uracil-DNA glycosylase
MPEALRVWAPHTWPVASDWRGLVDDFLTSPEGQRLATLMRQRLDAGATIFPPQPFHALALTALAKVKVVILGQDPYHGAGQAQGLAFSVAPGVPLPPSLRNIFKELARDPDVRAVGAAFQGSLAGWARQGVLLLNTCLTVEEGRPASHARIGWDRLTNAVIQAVVHRHQPVVFMLWGAHAQARQPLILSADDPQSPMALVLTANHPSPLSALRPPKPFLGCDHFSMANKFLQAHGQTAIEWADFDSDQIPWQLT